MLHGEWHYLLSPGLAQAREAYPSSPPRGRRGASRNSAAHRMTAAATAAAPAPTRVNCQPPPPASLLWACGKKLLQEGEICGRVPQAVRVGGRAVQSAPCKQHAGERGARGAAADPCCQFALG